MAEISGMENQMKKTFGKAKVEADTKKTEKKTFMPKARTKETEATAEKAKANVTPASAVEKKVEEKPSKPAAAPAKASIPGSFSKDQIPAKIPSPARAQQLSQARAVNHRHPHKTDDKSTKSRPVVSEKIEIKLISKTAGRGVVAEQDIKAGELVMCCPAL